jgi:glycosyltransferase involved in cell wall biosynthesis
MKIIHFITSLDKGGAETHLFNLAKEQSKIKNRVIVIYFKGKGYWKKELNACGIRTYFFPFKNLFNLYNLVFIYLEITKVINQFKPSIIHAHLSLAELIGLCAKLRYGNKIKLIITKHLDSFLFEGSSGRSKKIRGIFLEKFIFKFSNHIIFISENVKKYFLKKINLKKNLFSVIYYGYKIKKINIKLKNEFQKKYNLKKNNLKICTIARHVKQKNLEFLIKAFSKIIYEKKINSTLIIVGKGDQTKRLKSLAKEQYVDQKIIWIPYCKDIEELLKNMDIFCLTSTYEGFGLVLLEAISQKIPVIAAKVSAIPEIIKNNYSGVLYESNNYKQFLLGINKIIKNKSFKKKIISNSLVNLKKKFTLKKMTQQTQTLYGL